MSNYSEGFSVAIGWRNQCFQLHSMNYMEPILSFDSWQGMKQTLLQHNNSTEFSQLTVEEMQLGEKAMDFLRSAPPISWSGDCMVDLNKVDFSALEGQKLEELFNNILAPRYFQFVGLQGIDDTWFCQALNELNGLSNAETVKVLTDPASDPINLDFYAVSRFLCTRSSYESRRTKIFVSDLACFSIGLDKMLEILEQGILSANKKVNYILGIMCNSQDVNIIPGQHAINKMTNEELYVDVDNWPHITPLLTLPDGQGMEFEGGGEHPMPDTQIYIRRRNL